MIQSIDACTVNTSNDWYKCLRSINEQLPHISSGYCLTQTEIQTLSSHVGITTKKKHKRFMKIIFINLELNQGINYDCCQNLSQKNYCFLHQSKQYPENVSRKTFLF